MKKLTKKEVDAIFVQDILPFIRLKEQEFQNTCSPFKDIPMRCEEYNNFVDSLAQDDVISQSKASSYGIPFHLI